ncbi:MAG: AzlC family ABC transporter permease [Rhizobiaceae bacterium]
MTIFQGTAARDFRRGGRDGIPALVATFPFALLYGALAVSTGMSAFEAVLMSAAIFGGASQMVGIELFGQSVSPWLVVLSIFAVNFRHVLYSAAVGPRIAGWSLPRQAVGFFFLVDPLYAESELKAEKREPITFAWYMGMALTFYTAWVGGSAVGAAFGRLIPDPHAIGIDFLLPIYFLGLVMGFRKRTMWAPVVAASAVASVVAYNTIGSPWHVSVGALAGILLAAAMPVPRREKGADE